ncbi:hypothetical protein [Pedobacter changchengzhani]|nr:hypothetical protein [Pedobacter changchengzhani]
MKKMFTHFWSDYQYPPAVLVNSHQSATRNNFQLQSESSVENVKIGLAKFVFTLIVLLFVNQFCNAQTTLNIKKDAHYTPSFSFGNKILLETPKEGLWAIATGWENDWSTDWHYAQPDSMVKEGDWTILFGKIKLPNGTWHLRDAYHKEGDKIKCIRRFEWHSNTELDKVTLAIRWALPTYTEKVFMPGIMHYGNPSGYKDCATCVATFNKDVAPDALFEEHRFSMPFVSAELMAGKKNYGVSIHSLPTQVPYANIRDQWWSMGVSARNNTTELELLSGPTAMNGKKSVVKAIWNEALPYNNTWLNIKPNAIIEKTFYIEVHPSPQVGFAFKKAMDTNIDIFKPFNSEDMPSFKEIIDLKYQFANTRWFQDSKSAGFGMYRFDANNPAYVMGWCGQAASLGFALQELKPILKDKRIDNQVQRSLDFLATSPFNKDGFMQNFVVADNKWSNQDNVSQGQAMYNFAKAIESARKNKNYKIANWETFLKKASDIQAKRILAADWRPISTNEAFFIAPLTLASKMFMNKQYALAARKAADHYAMRHISMKEPYWGGTLDASCEDKEGAWAAFQGFMAMYELTKEQKYLDYATHAGYVTFSYMVDWDITMPASRLGDHYFKSRGWTVVSAQNQHLDAFGVFFTPELYKLGKYLKDERLQKMALLMFRSCGQMIDPFGSHGEQIQQTNYAQAGDLTNVYNFRGGYVEQWTVFWLTAHFLNAAARFNEIDPQIIQNPSFKNF